MIRVLVCGGRGWRNRDAIIREFLAIYEMNGPHVTIIHGAAPGADTLADEVAATIGWKRRSYPADWDKYSGRPGKNPAGMIRNRQMLDEGDPHFVLAFHEDLENKSKGTKDMVELARAAGVKVKVVDR